MRVHSIGEQLSQKQPEPLLVTARDAAAMLAMSERKLWSLTDQGRIRRMKIDGMVRYAVDDLRAFLQAELEASDA
jgi:hypothetical protein